MDADWVERPPVKLRVGGIVLCGGESRRMGTSKAWLRFGDTYLLERVVRVVSHAASPIVLAGRHGLELPPITPAVTVVQDDFEHAGPLAGIASGMKALRDSCDAVLVVPCDHPFVSAAVLHRMVQWLGGHAAVVPELEDKLFPTLALYRLDTLSILEDLLGKNELRAQEFARQCNPLRIHAGDLADIDPGARSFSNLNRPVEYEAALAWSGAALSKGPPCEH